MMNPSIIAISILGLALLILVVWVITLERRISKLLSGKNGASLEDAIGTNATNIQKLFVAQEKTDTTLDLHDKRINTKMNTAKTLRFNPFAGTGSGGNQSFATALLDEQGDGVVLSTLYAREKMSIFAKPVKNRASEFELTEEEQSVLK